MIAEATVLIVEDNIDVAAMTCEIVALSGLGAVYRTSVADALDYLASHPETTVALITDINLASPMSGIELAIYVAHEWPAISICVTSGATAIKPKRLPAKATYLSKPWSTADVLRFVEEERRRWQR